MSDHASSRLRYVDADKLDTRVLDLDGLDVRNQRDDHIGEVEGLLIDGVSGRPRYLVIDSGGWFRSRRFLLPIAHGVVGAEQSFEEDEQEDRDEVGGDEVHRRVDSMTQRTVCAARARRGWRQRNPELLLRRTAPLAAAGLCLGGPWPGGGRGRDRRALEPRRSRLMASPWPTAGKSPAATQSYGQRRGNSRRCCGGQT